MTNFEERNRIEEVDLRLRIVLKGHTHTTLSVIHFGPPHCKIVTCGMDCTIRIYDSSNNGKFISKLGNVHKRIIRHLIKWNREVFVSCSDDRTINFISIIPPFEVIWKVHEESSVYRLFKLNNDLLFTATYESSMSIISFSKRKVIRHLKSQKIIFCMHAVMYHSKEWENCFYLTTDRPQEYGTNQRNGPVLLINYQLDDTEKSFEKHKGEISAISIYQNENNEEILICCSDEFVYMHNASLVVPKIIKKLRFFENIYSCIVVNNEYLFLGEGHGSISVLDLFGTSSGKKYSVVNRVRIHNSSVQFLQAASMKTTHILSTSSDRTVKITDTGLPARTTLTEMERMDYSERTSYLIDLTEEESSCVGFSCLKINIFLRNPKIVFKSFLMLG